MLVVLSKEPEKKRSSSGILKETFEGFYTKCHDPNISGFCLKGIPIRRVFHPQTAVEAKLNSNAKNTMAKNSLGLGAGTFVGRRYKSPPPKELKRIDGENVVEGDDEEDVDDEANDDD
jgi:hypothetical protein